MTLAIALLLGIIVVASLCFAFEWASADVVALGVVITLAVTGLLPAKQVFAGFGSDTVIMILGLLILTVSLVENGVMDSVGRYVLRVTGDHPGWLLLAVTLPVALLSSFISNTAATALFVPIAIAIAQRAKVSASRLLLPLACSSILASSVTLISTSTTDPGAGDAGGTDRNVRGAALLDRGPDPA
jgi:di/tricarboxylate transporter